MDIYILPAFLKCEDSVNLCMACNDKYAPYCALTIYSFLKNSDKSKKYDILIMETDISPYNKERICGLSKGREQVSIRFIDMTQMEKAVQYDVGAYYSVETNFRLYLFSELFREYHKMLYLDCDIVVLKDCCDLYQTDLEGYAGAAVEDYTFGRMQYLKFPLFVENVPYSVRNYRREVLHLNNEEQYFNAGVLLLDLDACRLITDEHRAIKLLHSNQFIYNDQDVLNQLFNEKFKKLDVRWNYLNCYEMYLHDRDKKIVDMYLSVFRESPSMLHYTGGRKPWNDDKTTFVHIYQRWMSRLRAEHPEWKD